MDNMADHAIDRVSGSRLFSYTTEPCQNTCYGSIVHGMQSGLS